MIAAETLGPWLLAATLIAPAALLVAVVSRNLRRRALSLQWLAPAPALAAAALALFAGPFGLEAPALRLSLRLDLPGALLLAVSALLWSAVSAGQFRVRDGEPDLRFTVAWLLTMIGSLGVFIADDLLSFYLVYALVSIPGLGHDRARRRPGVEAGGRRLHGLRHSRRSAAAHRLRHAGGRRAERRRRHSRRRRSPARLALAGRGDRVL